MSKLSKGPKVEPFSEDPERVARGFQRLLDAGEGIQDRQARVKAMAVELRKIVAERKAEEAEKAKKTRKSK